MKRLDLVEKNLPIIERIITNQSISNVPYTYKKEMDIVAKENNISICINCNSTLYKLTQRIWKMYNEEKESNENKKAGRKKAVKNG